jgi:hypothetical protein
MQQRVPLLFLTGALAFGSLGYFLFGYDDGSTPHTSSLLHPLPTKKVGGGAGKPTGSAAAEVHRITPGGDPLPGMATPPTAPAQIATTPEPANTAPPE